MKTLFVIPSFEILIAKRLLLTQGGFLFSVTLIMFVVLKRKLNLNLNPCNKRHMLVTMLDEWTIGRPAAGLQGCLSFAFCKHN